MTELIIISDDINLPPGQLRVRKKGSAGGHNGLKNIILHLGHDQFIRLRMGVGEKTAGYELKDYKESVAAYRSALDHRNKSWDDNHVSDLYGMMGDILHQMGKEQEAFAAYDSSLVWNENNYTVLNNYAYFLSQKGVDLDRAAKMSLKAVNGDPNNANSIDTYAWVLFEQKKYDEARQFIDLALQVDTDTTGDNSTFFEHAGDIYFMMGETDKAVGYWKKALDMGNKSTILPKKVLYKKYLKE